MRVSLIMPALNEEATVDSTLESIYAQTRRPDEIVVADGGSTDRTLEILEEHKQRGEIPLIVVPNPDKFCGGGRNAAVEASSGDLFVGMDFGNKAHPDYVRSLLEMFEADPDLDYAGGPHYVLLDTPFSGAYGAALEYWAFLIPSIPRDKLMGMVPNDFRPGGMNLAFTRRVFDSSGGFCPWAGSCDDVLFGLRLQEMQAQIKATPDAIVYYHMGRSFSETWKRFKNYARWSGRLGLQARTVWHSARPYLLMLCIAALGIVWWPLWIVAGLLLALYFFRIGPLRCWRIARKTEQRFTWRQQILASVIRVVYDVAYVSGWIRGRLERSLSGRWRSATKAYLTEGQRNAPGQESLA